MLAQLRRGQPCSGTTAKGTTVGCDAYPCTTRLLYEDPNGKNQGWSCTGETCSSNRKDLEFDYHGDPNSFWLAGQNQKRRPTLGDKHDKDLAKALGLKPGDELPLLDRSGYERLGAADKKRYRELMPTISQSDKDLAGLRYLKGQSDDEWDRAQYEKILPHEKVDELEKALGDGRVDSGERRSLRPGWTSSTRTRARVPPC